MASILVLSIAIIPMVGMFDMGLTSATRSGNFDKARALANKQLETAKSLPYERAVGDFPDGTGAPTAGAELVTDDQVDPEYPDFTYTVTKQFVYLDTSDNTVEPISATSTETSLMKVTVTVTRPDSSTTYTSSTVIADGGDPTGSVFNGGSGGTGGTAPPPAPRCSDGSDNDTDGEIDHPEDPGCSSPEDDSESPDPPRLSVNDVSVTEGNSGTRNLTFTVTLTGDTTDVSTVQYATANGTATTANNDYNSTSGTLTFGTGETSKTVSVTVRGDTAYEPNENFSLNLSNATVAVIEDGQGVGTITNDDAAPAISVNDQSVAEGNSGTRNLTFTLTRTGDTTITSSVSYSTSNGTATTANNDYNSASGTVTFAPGETSKTVNVTVRGDTNVESDENFNLDLTNPVDATISDNRGVGTIRNDDTGFSVNDVSISEGNNGNTSFTFTVTRAGDTSITSTVQYNTSDGTATTANNDYNSTSGTLNFGAGVTTRTVTVTVRGDRTREPDETFFLNLLNPTNAVLSDNQGTGTIRNDD